MERLVLYHGSAAEVYEDKFGAAKTHRNAIAILLRFIGAS